MARWRLRWLQLYYWATPLFFVLDAAWGVNVRASFLPDTGPRFMYYAFCLGCAWWCQHRPEHAPVVGLGESAVNLLLLVLSVMLPLYSLPEAFLEGAPVEGVMTTGRLINVFLSGTMLVVSFQRNQLAIARRVGWRAGRPGQSL